MVESAALHKLRELFSGEGPDQGHLTLAGFPKRWIVYLRETGHETEKASNTPCSLSVGEREKKTP